MENEDLVDQLRERILKDKIINKLSINEVKRFEETWWLQKFIDIANEDIDIAYSILFECLKWRNTMEIEYISILSLKSLMEKQLMYIRGKDRKNNDLLWLNWSAFNPGDNLTETLFVFWLENHTLSTNGKPMTIIIDMSGTKTKHMDIKVFKLFLHYAKYYYPNIIDEILIYESPPMFSASWKVINSCATDGYPSLVQTTIATIQDKIDPCYLKSHQGGEDQFIFTMDKLLEYLPEPQILTERAFKDDEIEADYGRRNVTFDDMNIGRKQPLTLTRRPSKGPGKRSSTPTNVRQLADARLSSTGHAWFSTKSISVSPKEELSLAKLDGETDFIDVVMLKNESTTSLMYKIKTTSPEKFRVRPSTGFVNPGCTEYVRVYLQKEYEHSCTKEKFLLMGLLTSEMDLEKFSEIWKSSNQAQKIEHKLKCRLTGTDPIDTRPERKSSLLSSQQEAIEHLQNSTASIIKTQRWMIIALVIIILIQIFLMTNLLGEDKGNSDNITIVDNLTTRDDL